jgi:hypothetical protein
MTQWRKPPNRETADGEERAALEALAETVIGAAYEVSNVLRAGFVELALLINFRRPKVEWRPIIHNL